MVETLKLEIDTSEVIKQIEGLEEMIHHYRCLPILIEGIKTYMPQPFKAKILAEWDEQRSKKGQV